MFAKIEIRKYFSYLGAVLSRSLVYGPFDSRTSCGTAGSPCYDLSAVRRMNISRAIFSYSPCRQASNIPDAPVPTAPGLEILQYVGQRCVYLLLNFRQRPDPSIISINSLTANSRPLDFGRVMWLQVVCLIIRRT